MRPVSQPQPGSIAALRRLRLVLMGAALAGIVLVVVGVPELRALLLRDFLDLDVYRLGARALLTGGELYGPLPDTRSGENLPFTYPPFAALLFTPLAIAPVWFGDLAFAFVSLGSLFVVVWLTLRQLTGHPRPGRLTLMVFALSVLAGPISETFILGQVNLVLMALVVADVTLGNGRRWQGSLIGIAAAVKLTPIVFLAYFLVRGNWRAFVTGALAATTATVVGFAIAWHDSVSFWTDALLAPSRIGDPARVLNQSLSGAMARAGLDDREATWFAICFALGIAAMLLARVLCRAGDDLGALLALAFFGLLASPVSWVHHWVWIVPAMMYMVYHYLHSRRLGWLVLSLTGGVTFSGGSWVALAILEYRRTTQSWAWWEHIAGSALAVWGFAFLVGLAVHARSLSNQVSPEPTAESRRNGAPAQGPEHRTASSPSHSASAGPVE